MQRVQFEKMVPRLERASGASPTACRLKMAALAETSYALDRERVARTLGMVDEQGRACVCQNSLDAVSDRDFAIEFTAAAAPNSRAEKPAAWSAT